jgi:hypothetical protein
VVVVGGFANLVIFGSKGPAFLFLKGLLFVRISTLTYSTSTHEHTGTTMVSKSNPPGYAAGQAHRLQEKTGGHIGEWTIAGIAG